MVYIHPYPYMGSAEFRTVYRSSMPKGFGTDDPIRIINWRNDIDDTSNDLNFQIPSCFFLKTKEKPKLHYFCIQNLVFNTRRPF